MNKKFWVSVVTVFVLSMAIGFTVHHVLLGDDYRMATGVFRQMEGSDSTFPFIVAANIIFSYGFVWVYLRGREEKPFVGQGLRYGFAVAILCTIPAYLIEYAVHPLPGVMVAKQLIFDTIGVLIMGVVVAGLNKTV
jgi:hypothetical protein